MELVAFKPILIGLASLLLLGGGYYFYDQSQDRAAERDKATLRADSLMAAKLTLERDTSQLGTQLRMTQSELVDLNEKVEQVTRQVAQKTVQLNRIQRQNAGRAAEASQLAEEIAQLTAQRDSMTTQLTGLTSEKQQLIASNTQLTSRTDTLTREVTMLNERIGGMAPLSAVTADAFRVEVMKPNDKVTSKAKKADVLAVSFTLPTALSRLGTQPVNVMITDAPGQPTAITEVKDMTTGIRPIYVQTSKSVDFAKLPQSVAFQLEPTERLKSGTYRVIAYAGSTYLGSAEFTLRDSFWFF